MINVAASTKHSCCYFIDMQSLGCWDPHYSSCERMFISGKKMKILKGRLSWSCLLAGMCLAHVVQASEIDASLKTTEQSHRKNQQTQLKLDGLDERAQQAFLDYQQNQQQADLVEAYNKQLSLMVASQQQELDDLQSQLGSLEATQQAALPLLADMLEGLAHFVAQDLPFLPQERQQRLAKLQNNLVRADVSLAEKYRQVLEAYQIEIEYGRTIEAYQGKLTSAELKSFKTLPTHDGDELQVDFFRLGRTALYFQSLDSQISGLWDPQQQAWVSLPKQHNLDLRSAIQIAWQQSIPELLTLPLNPIERGL